LAKAVEQLRVWTENGEAVYLHCYLGIGRAPTVGAAFLASAYELSLGEALARIKAARPRASPTAQQLVVLAGYVSGLRRGRAEAGREVAGA
jgi:protein-tyrosine phosphatase